MYDWLFEGRIAVYVVLAAVAVVALIAWKQVPRRGYLIAFTTAVVLLGVYVLLDRLVETDREQIERKTKEMAAAVRTGSVDAILAHVSDDFRVGSVDKERFGTFVENTLRSHRVDEVVVWDFAFADPPRSPFQVGGRATQIAPVFFQAKPEGGVATGAFFRVDARFVRDPDGQWRLFDFEVRGPMPSDQQVQVPGM